MRLPDQAENLLLLQHGVAARRQLLAWMSPDAVDSHVGRGNLVPLHWGVYRSSQCPPLPEQLPLAAALRVGPGAKITGPFVLAMHGVDGTSRHNPWEILVPPGRRVGRIAFASRRDPTPHGAVQRIERLPLVSVTAALVDSARFVPAISARTLRLAFDSCRWRRLTTVPLLRRRIAELGPSDAGARLFAEWDERGELTPESDGERRLGRVICRVEPVPEPQVVIGRYRIDWYWRAFRFGYEYQGVTDHSSAANRLADTERAHALHRRGVEIHPVTATDLRDEDAFLRRTLRLLTSRARELGVAAPAIV